MTDLPNITVVIITTCNHGPAIAAIKKTLEQIKPAKVIFFSNILYNDPDFECIEIENINLNQYSEFVIKEAWKYVETSHLLIIQWDGYVLDSTAWREEFLDYDYIGAPWRYGDGRNVGNGGFSLRSKRLHQVIAQDKFIDVYHPEDEVICRLYRGYLSNKYKIKYAPDDVAHRFSFEMHKPMCSTFGFHSYFHKPWKTPIIIKRTACLGDVIMVEPVLEYFHNMGRRVIINTLPQYFNLFHNHHYPIEHTAFLKEDISTWETINLDMAYENKPKQLALKSYFETAGITDYSLRNPRLNFSHAPALRLFDEPYVVLHIDDTAMAHRNVHGVNWKDVVGWIELYTQYKVFQIGKSSYGKAALKFNSATEELLGFLMNDARYFIGIDSGPSQVAIACGVESIIFFGSVNPAYRYHDLSKVHSFKLPCGRPNCYHDVVSEIGTDCIYDKVNPPCITWTTDDVIDRLKLIIK
jgi:hypothetical protein